MREELKSRALSNVKIELPLIEMREGQEHSFVFSLTQRKVSVHQLCQKLFQALQIQPQ